jgi:enoyl-CoA hydratase/carnithine racemase
VEYSGESKHKGTSVSDYNGKPAEAFGFKHITYEKSRHRATVTFNRPAVHNAVNGAMLVELIAAFQDAAWDDDVRVLILTGTGDKAFCTGADVKEQAEEFVGQPGKYWKWMGLFIEAHEKLRNIGKPTIARLNGMVVGGGNEFNMSCDLAIAADDIIIRQVGAARGSVAAAGATQFLPRIIGDRRAREMLFLCEDVPAKKALEWGLVNEVVPRAKLDAAVDAMAAKLIDKLPVCLRYAKEQLNFWRNFSWHLTIGHAKEFLALNNLSPEVAEGMRAFVEKRPVDYEQVRREIK